MTLPLSSLLKKYLSVNSCFFKSPQTWLDAFGRDLLPSESFRRAQNVRIGVGCSSSRDMTFEVVDFQSSMTNCLPTTHCLDL